MNSALPLADGFPRFTEDDWRAAVARARQGHEGGPDVAGLFQRRIGARAVAGRPHGQPWRIVDRIDAADPALAARAVADALEGGATGIEVVFAPSFHPLRSAMPVEGARDLATALDLPEGFLLRVDFGDFPETAIDAFLDLAARRKLELVFTFDPIAAHALRGGFGADNAPKIRSIAAAFGERGVAGTIVTADGRLWHAGGVTEEQELGITLATFVSHLRALGAADRIDVSLAADSDQFRGIAKFRAMRLLLARIMEIGQLTSPAPRIHAETAWRTVSARDPQMNILRGTSAAFAAAVGGADSIAVLPFDAVTQGKHSGARRIARNTQVILAEEAHLFRVADPGAGSGAIEALTAMFAEAAWRRFQAIEAEGGIVSALAEGSLLREIADARETRMARVAKSGMKMIGVNAFRNDSATATVKLTPVKRTGPLIFKRLSAPFEEIQ